MTKVKMLKSVQGSPNGITIMSYSKGNTYDVGDDLLESFVGMGVIDLVEEGVPEPKMASVAPMNKAIDISPSNKVKNLSDAKKRFKGSR